MAKTFTYELDGNLYINLTNKCSNACEFCVRNGKDTYYGNNLKLDYEPTATDVLESIDFSKKYNEVVFCGFGEPTYRLQVLTEVAGALKEKGYTVRLNTNGQGNLINGFDITEELAKCIDKVNVSLNAPFAEEYQNICHSVYGKKAFDALIEFAENCKRKEIETVLSVVDCIGEKAVKECKTLADEHGLTLKVRETIKDS